MKTKYFIKRDGVWPVTAYLRKRGDKQFIVGHDRKTDSWPNYNIENQVKNGTLIEVSRKRAYKVVGTYQKRQVYEEGL